MILFFKFEEESEVQNVKQQQNNKNNCFKQ